MIPTHVHAGDIAAVKSEIIKGKIIKKAKKEDAKPTNVVFTALHEVLSPVAALLPLPSSMTRTVNRIRHKHNPQLLDPISRRDGIN